MEINVRKRSNAQLIQLRGSIKLGEAVDSLRGAMEELLTAGETRMVLNLSEVPIVDSSGIGLLVRVLVSAKQRGGNVKLVNPSKFTMQTLRVVGVVNLFEVFENEDAAIDSFA